MIYGDNTCYRWSNWASCIILSANKRTRSLSNAICFKHDNNICTCTISFNYITTSGIISDVIVSAFILLPVVNLSLKMYSATSISYMTRKVSPFDVPFVNFSLRMRSFNHITTSGIKPDVIFEFSAPVFL